MHTPEVTIQILWLVGLSSKWSVVRISEPISLLSPPLCSNLSNYIWLVTSIISFIFSPPSFSHPTNHTQTYTNTQLCLLTPILLSVSAGNVSHAAFNNNYFLHHWSHSICFSFLFISPPPWSSSMRFVVERWIKCLEMAVFYKEQQGKDRDDSYWDEINRQRRNTMVTTTGGEKATFHTVHTQITYIYGVHVCVLAGLRE